ncbi:MAG: endonuclease/exonuclease/phosphatase family protein [Armatimonadetes bacterium]|nr:endonuclease/exonuclease/phosphatase family protein [Armatimonadota bacterium]
MCALGAVACIVACFGIIETNSPVSRPAGKADLRVLAINVHFGSREMPELLAFVRSQNLDIVFLEENFGGESSPADYLQKNLPGWNLVARKGVAILSRYPVSNTSAVDLNKGIFHALLSTVVDVQGRKVRAIAIHWSAPQSAEGWNPVNQAAINKVEELAKTLNVLSESELPTVFGGDLNTPPRHHAISTLQAQYESCFLARGSGLGWTYPNRLPIIQVDHLFVNAGLQTLDAYVSPKVGSDHRGLVAELRIR